MDTLKTQRVRFLTEYFKKLRDTGNVSVEKQESLSARFELFEEILDVLSNEESLLIFEVSLEYYPFKINS